LTKSEKTPPTTQTPTGQESGEDNSSPAYFLLDANTVAQFYLAGRSHTPPRTRFDRLVAAKGIGRAFLYIPNFCIAEVFNVFSDYYFRRKRPWPEGAKRGGFKRVCGRFRDDVHGGTIFYGMDLNRNHIVNIDRIAPFAQRFAPRNKRKPSTYDLLIIAMGIELQRIHGDRFWIATNDEPLSIIAKRLTDHQKITRGLRRTFGVPDWVEYPKCLYLPTDELPQEIP